MADPNKSAAGSLKNLTDSKLIQFAIGTQKKSRFQKAREDKETKKKQEEEEAAKVYESFVASFKDDDENGGKTFVRGGRSDSDGRVMGGNSGDVYKMPNAPSAPKSSKPLTEMEKLAQEIKVCDIEFVVCNLMTNPMDYYRKIKMILGVDLHITTTNDPNMRIDHLNNNQYLLHLHPLAQIIESLCQRNRLMSCWMKSKEVMIRKTTLLTSMVWIKDPLILLIQLQPIYTLVILLLIQLVRIP